MSETTTETGVSNWVKDTYDHWLRHFEGNSHLAAEQVILHLEDMGKRDLTSMRSVVDELRNVAGDEVFKHVVGDGLSPASINNALQKRFLAVARKTVGEK